MFTDHDSWIGQITEDAIDPELAICDAHHHLWLDGGHTGWPYPLEAFRSDAGSGHNIVKSVYLECGSQYRTDGPVHLQPLGETEWVANLAESSATEGEPEIAGIVASADVTLGEAVEEVVAGHEAVGRGRFCGIRYMTAQDDHPPLRMNVPDGVMQTDNYLAGVRTVHSLGYTYDAGVYHPQLPELVEVARRCADGVIVANHLCMPIGVGPYKDKRSDVMVWWREQVAELAKCDNVVLKLGGIGMPMFGFRWDKQDQPPTSIELAEPWTSDIQFCIETFGPERCMFESNFPVDKRGVGYAVLWNAFKRITDGCSSEEKRELFHDTALRAYGLASD